MGERTSLFVTKNIQEEIEEKIGNSFGPNTDINPILKYYHEDLHKYIKEPKTYKYGYALVIEERHLKHLNKDNTMPLIKLTWSDYICTKHKGSLTALRYNHPNVESNVGDTLRIVENWETSFGEGIYVFDMTLNTNTYENDTLPEYQFNPERSAMILEGDEVEYLRCRVSNSEPKDNELLVLPPYTMKVIDICKSQEDLDRWILKQYNQRNKGGEIQ